MSTDDWWPKQLAHVARERPWDDAHVVVAEVKSFEGKPYPGHRRTFSVLVPMDQIAEVAQNLAKLGNDISTSGPHPSPDRKFAYEPNFWIDARDLPAKKYEPLVLSWRSHDKTVLLPDPGFLMTYGLAPRPGKDGLIAWDDPAAPVHDVVLVSGPSIWDFPTCTPAYVSIRKDFLEDYLTLRAMALVQVFWEEQWGETDGDIEKKLGDAEAVDVSFSDRLFQLNRYLEDRKIVAAQVWGGRLVAVAGNLPISENSLETAGLLWPGFPKPVTDGMAMQMTTMNRVYVDDTVLAAFEGRPGYRINPNTGSVSFGTQWGVGFCDRVGRNLIRLELKKLYEGVRPNITRHWNRFAVAPLPDAAYPAVLHERHIAIRAKEVTFAMVSLGEALEALANSVGLNDLSADRFVGLRRRALDYHGWWTFEETEPIARHVPLDLPMDAFLERCLKLNKLISEGLNESALRRTLYTLGVPVHAIEKFRTMKLLDALVRMSQVGARTGLSLSKNGELIWQRLAEEGTEPQQPLHYLFALYDIRILAGHKAEGTRANLMNELDRFGITPGEESTGYGRILDTVYDLLSAQLQEVATKIEAAI